MPAGVEDTLFLPGLSPVAGKKLDVRFDGDGAFEAGVIGADSSFCEDGGTICPRSSDLAGRNSKRRMVRLERIAKRRHRLVA